MPFTWSGRSTRALSSSIAALKGRGVSAYATVLLAEALDVSDEGLFGLAMLAAFVVGCLAGLLRRRNGLLLVLVLSVASAMLHRWVVAPVGVYDLPILSIVLNVGLGIVVLVVACLGVGLANLLSRALAR